VQSPSRPVAVESVEVFHKTKCATPKEIANLKEMMGEREFETYLLYSGSRDGWMAIDFHSRSDGKGPTISLFKRDNGLCIGGFTTA
jgi:hypothetical protein